MNAYDTTDIGDFMFLSTLDLNKQLVDKLVKASFRTQEDFKGQTITSLAKEAGVSHKEAQTILNKIKNVSGTKQSISAQPSIILSQANNPTQTQSAPVANMASGLDLFEQNREHLATLCRELDAELLNGGIPCGSVTEICRRTSFSV
jgi:hypothetical protein